MNQRALLSPASNRGESRRNWEKPRSVNSPGFHWVFDSFEQHHRACSGVAVTARRPSDPVRTTWTAVHQRRENELRRLVSALALRGAFLRGKTAPLNGASIGPGDMDSQCRHERTRQSLTLCVRAETDDDQGYMRPEPFRDSEGRTQAGERVSRTRTCGGTVRGEGRHKVALTVVDRAASRWQHRVRDAPDVPGYRRSDRPAKVGRPLSFEHRAMGGPLRARHSSSGQGRVKSPSGRTDVRAVPVRLMST